MTGILTLTLNPSVDLSTSVSQITAGPKLRCDMPEIEPGGGGINVARAIRILGGDATALVAVGGSNGARLISLLTQEGVPHRSFAAPGETRESFAVTDASTAKQLRFVLPGPNWSEEDVDRFVMEVVKAEPIGGYVVLSGSQPPGVPPNFSALLSGALAGHDIRLVIDTSGAPLRHLVEDKTVTSHILRMDHAEAEELAGTTLSNTGETAEFAKKLIGDGAAEIVILARGSDGNVLVSAKTALHCTSADVPVVSPVGAGDSFVGALVLALSEGADDAEALQRGGMAASSAVSTEGTQLCRKADMTRLLSQCVVTEI